MDFMDNTKENQFFDDTEDNSIPVSYQNPDPLRAQAAMLALTQKGYEQAQDNYLALKGTGVISLEGVYQKTQEQAMTSLAEMTQSLGPILSDPSVPWEKKSELIHKVRTKQLRTPDSSEILAAEFAKKDPETDSYSEKVLNKNARDFLAEGARQWTERQTVINAATAGHDGTLKKIADFAGIFAPMGDAYLMANVQKGANTEAPELSGNAIYSMLLPGSSFAEFHKKFHQLPFDEQTLVMKQLTETIQQSSSLMTSDNQLRASSFISALNDPEYSNWEKYSTNAFNILDAIGLGQLIKAGPALVRGGVSAAKGLAERKAMANLVSDLQARIEPSFDPTDGVQAPARTTTVQPGDLATVTSTPQRQANSARIEELENQHAALLGEELEPLAKGTVTRLEAEKAKLQEKLDKEVIGKSRKSNVVEAIRDSQKNLQAQIARIDETLARNAIAEQNIQQISSIEKELKTLRSSKALEDIPKSAVNDAVQRAFMQSTVFTHNARTAGNIAMNINPAEARRLYAATVVSESDEVAQAVFGSSKADAAMMGVTPQVTDATGAVRFVTPDIERGVRRMLANMADDVILDPVAGIQFTDAEKAAARANIVNDYSNAVGISLHPAMTSVQTAQDGSKVSIRAVYMAGDTGWASAEDAISQAKFALRSRGISDQDIGLMKRQGDEFVPVKLEDVQGVSGEYAITISKDEFIDASDVSGDWSKLDVKKNFFDRLFGSGKNEWGSVQSHVLPVTSMLHPTIVRAATVADDKVSVLSKTLLEGLDKFAQPYLKLPKNRQSAVTDYIVEANAKRLAFDTNDLVARGFTGNEIDMLRKWREFWDDNWKLENLDVVRALNNQGYQWLESPNLNAAVKPRGKNYGISLVYDPMADMVRSIDRAEIDQIYAAGGNISEFRRPVTLNGFEAEFTIVRNNPGEYSRKLTPSDRILEKIDGYYQVHHKAARYIVETVKGVNDKERTVVIETAGTIKDADKIVELLLKRNPQGRYTHRGEERGLYRDSDAYWDLNTSSGRIAQRHRGKLIQQNVGLQVTGTARYIENPVESGIRAASSISGRTMMRPMLEAAKERFMAQYGHLVPAREGMKTFPQSLDEIAKVGEMTTKELADARTTWNYIQSLENGYVNAVDATYKNAMRLLGDTIGNMGWQRLERGARLAEEASLSGAYKTTVFSTMIGANPIRQWIIQTNQGLRAMAYNPQGFASGSVYKYLNTPVQKTMGVSLSKEQQAFYDFMQGTGVLQAISKNNLIRGTLIEAADTGTQIGRNLNKVPDALRRVGFDVGEKGNLYIHGAAVFDEYVRAGKDVTKRSVQAEMHDRIRAITLDMNFAGDMPYNQNALSFLMTYMQVPHKALTAVTSRRIPADIRNRMAAFDLAMWGLPTQAIAKAMDLEGISPEDPDVRRLVEEGLQAWMLNKMWSTLDPDGNTDVDYSSLSPFGIEGWTNMVSAMWFDGGISKTIDSSAGGRIFGFGMDSRMGAALQMTKKYLSDFYENPADPTTVLDVLDSWGRMSSGWSNFQKARMKWMMGVSQDKYGNLTDSNVSKIAAVNQLLGFPTKAETSFFETKKAFRDEFKSGNKAAEDDVNKLVQLMQMRKNGTTMDDHVGLHLQMMYSTPFMIENPKQKMDYIRKVQERLGGTPEQSIMGDIVKALGYPDMNRFEDIVRNSPIGEEEKSRVINIFKNTRGNTRSLISGE